MTNRWGNNGNRNKLYFLGSKITAYGDCSHEIKRCLLLGRKDMTNLDSILKSRGIIFPTKVCQSCGFSSSHVQMWELDHKEGWALKNWCFLIVVLEKTLESLSVCKEIKPVNPKGNQSWIFFGRTDAEVEAPILWPSAVKNWLTGKGSGPGKDWEHMKGWQRMRWLYGIINSKDMGLSKLQEVVGHREAWHATVRGVASSQTWLSDWTIRNCVASSHCDFDFYFSSD